MHLKAGLTVYDAEGDKVGDVTRIVIDPVSLDVSHVVVEKGFFFKEDHVVPAGAIKESGDGNAYLDPGYEAADFPAFEQRTFFGFDPATRAYQPSLEGSTLIFFPPVGAWGTPAYVDTAPPAVVRNVPEGSVSLEPGAPVTSADGDHLGDVEEVLTAGDTGTTTHLVIEEGVLFKHRKLVPTAWVASVDDDGVRLAVNADVVENAPEYEEG